MGFLKVVPVFKPLIKGEEVFSDRELIKSINTMELAMINKRSKSGVLKVTTHHIENLEMS